MLVLIILACAGYAYRINAKRAEDDPQKRNYHPIAIILAPVTFPLFLLGTISIFILRTLTYGVFLILITIALLAFRNPFILAWLRKTAAKIGDVLLNANTLLLRLFVKPWANQPGAI